MSYSVPRVGRRWGAGCHHGVPGSGRLHAGVNQTQNNAQSDGDGERGDGPVCPEHCCGWGGCTTGPPRHRPSSLTGARGQCHPVLPCGMLWRCGSSQEREDGKCHSVTSQCPPPVSRSGERAQNHRSVLQPQPGPGRVLTWARGRRIGCSLRFGCQHQIHWPRSGSRGAIGGREFPGPGPAPRGLSPRWGPGCAEPKPPQALPLPRWSRARRGGRGCAPPFHAGGGRWALGSGSAECSSADGGGKFQAVADGGRGMGSEGGPAWGQ